MTLYQLVKQILVNQIKKWRYLILIFVVLLISGIVVSSIYFLNMKGSPEQWFDHLFYILLLSYAPYCYLMMERLYRNQEISLLSQFALENRRLVFYLVSKTSAWLTIPFLILLLILLPTFFVNPTLGKSVVLNLVLYHLIFVTAALSIFGYGAKVMIDPDYDSLKNALSGGWTDPQLTPTLFAPGVLFATVNLINVVVAKTVESIFFNHYVNTLYLYVILAMTPISFIIGMRYLIRYLRKLYAILAGLNHLYYEGSYQLEAGFIEDRIQLKQEMKPLFFKDVRLLKRRFRVQVILTWVAPLIILISTTLSNKGQMVLLIALHTLGMIPVINLFYPPVEGVGATFFPIKRQQFLFTKYLASAIYFAPYWISYLLLGFITGTVTALILILLTIFQPLLSGYSRYPIMIHAIPSIPLFYALFMLN